LKRNLTILATIIIILIVVLSLFLVQNYLSSSQNQTAPHEFYVGVMFAYGNQTSQVKALVDKVSNYTNLIVLGSVDLFHNEPALDEACDYIYNANLSFIVQFRGLDKYNYTITDWMQTAQTKYGNQFLGIYRYDEPGGRQLDGDETTKLLNYSITNPKATYQQIAEAYVGNLSYFPSYYLQFTPQMFTADYALYWFDYKAGYNAIFAEFVGNESRARHIALCRGAASTLNRDWGIIITWKYNQVPYLESGEDMYNDLSLAYSSGAKYAVVFSYPDSGEYGTLTETHFEALQRFWNTLHANPGSFKEKKAEVAYVVPADYGFGFRSATDTIWGLFPPDNRSAKIYNDVELLMGRYGAGLDILYDGPESAARFGNYSRVYLWNQTVS
jgi:hypothetical protein